MKKAYFFDVDDTLCDTGKSHARAFDLALAEIGFSGDFNYSEYIGLNTEEVFSKILGSQDLIEKAIQSKRNFYKEIAKETEPMKGAREILEYLSRGKTPIFAVSAGSKSSVETSLASAGLMIFLDEVITCERTTRQKPFPDPYHLAVSICGLPASDCLAVEDSESGVKSALAANLDVVVVNNKHLDWIQKYEIRKFDSLLDFLYEIEI
jgi:HAD superfamily hydrolase (TIGR01509 family)